jgi:hypothetical protein
MKKKRNKSFFLTQEKNIMARNPRSEHDFGHENTTAHEGSHTEQKVQSGTPAEPVAPVEPPDMTGWSAARKIAYQASLKDGAPKKPGKAKKEGVERVKITVNDPESGQPIGRQELIKRLWTEDKLSRSEITSVLNDATVNTTGKKIPYQIVFAALKGVAGGPAEPSKPSSGTAHQVESEAAE